MRGCARREARKTTRTRTAARRTPPPASKGASRREGRFGAAEEAGRVGRAGGVGESGGPFAVGGCIGVERSLPRRMRRAPQVLSRRPPELVARSARRAQGDATAAAGSRSSPRTRSVPRRRLSSERRRSRSRTSRVRPWPPGWAPGPPPPDEAPVLLLPAGHRVRLHRLEMAAPVGHAASRFDPEEPIGPAHPGPPAGAPGDGELQPQRHVLRHEGWPAPGRHGPRAQCRRGAATGPTRRSDRLRCLAPHAGGSCAPTGDRAPAAAGT